jgi:hypothetical protein
MNQLPQPDPRGELVFDALPDELQAAEDATAAADHERAHADSGRSIGPILHSTRPATPTERILLAHLGYTVPDQLTTVVSYYTTGVRNRTWPQLEGAQL